MNRYEEDQARREIAAVTNQDFANCVYPPRPKKLYDLNDLLDWPQPPWTRRPRTRIELPQDRPIRFTWPRQSFAPMSSPGYTPSPRWATGECRFITYPDRNLTRCNIQVSDPDGQTKYWGIAINNDMLTYNLRRQVGTPIYDGVAVGVEYGNGNPRAFIELEG